MEVLNEVKVGLPVLTDSEHYTKSSPCELFSRLVAAFVLSYPHLPSHRLLFGLALMQETEGLVMVADLLNTLSNKAIKQSNSSAHTLVPTSKGHTSCGLPCVTAKCANSLLYHVDATALRDTLTLNV